MKFYLLLLVFVFFAGKIKAQKDFHLSVDTIMLKKHVLTLASDSFQGRKLFTIGETRTVDYLANYFKKIGMEPGNENSFVQEVTVLHTNADIAPTINVRSKNKEFKLENGKDYALFSFAPDGETVLDNVEVVFAGYGINAASYGHNDYKDVDVKGKVVMVLMNERNQKESFLQKGRSVTFYETPDYKLQEAARRGAKACLLVLPSSVDASIQYIQASLNAAKLHLPDDIAADVMGFMNRVALYKILSAAGFDSSVITRAGKKRL